MPPCPECQKLPNGSMCEKCTFKEEAKAMEVECEEKDQRRERSKSPLVSSAERTQKCQRVEIGTPSIILPPVQPFPMIQRVVADGEGEEIKGGAKGKGKEKGKQKEGYKGEDPWNGVNKWDPWSGGDGGGGVGSTSSNDDIMTKLNTIITSMATEDFGIIENKMSNLSLSVDTKFKSIETRLDGTDARVTKMEGIVINDDGGDNNYQWVAEIEAMKKEIVKLRSGK